jgi:hypothetical protein
LNTLLRFAATTGTKPAPSPSPAGAFLLAAVFFFAYKREIEQITLDTDFSQHWLS